MTEQIVAWCQVALKKSLIESVWDDPRCQAQVQRFPKDPLRIPFNDPDPQVHSSAVIPAAMSDIILTAVQLTTPLSREYPWHTQIHRDAYGYGAIPSEIDQRLVVDLRFFTYVKPVYDNYVEFSAENTDCFGMPQVRLSLPLFWLCWL